MIDGVGDDLVVKQRGDIASKFSFPFGAAAFGIFGDVSTLEGKRN
jgi:hypothetical protein